MLDPDVDEPPDEVRQASQVDEGVTPAATGQVHRPGRPCGGARTFGEPGVRIVVGVAAGRHDRLDEDLAVVPDPCPVALEADRLLEGEELVQAASLDRRSDVVGEMGGGRPGPDRVGGREDLVVADRLEQAQGRLELGFGLAAEARRSRRC